MILEPGNKFKKMQLNCVDGDKQGVDYKYPQEEFILTSSEVNSKEFSRRSKNPRVRYQGQLGTCVGMAGVSVLEDNGVGLLPELSPYFLYKTAQEYDYWEGEDYSGTSVSGGCEALRKIGCCREEVMPYPMSESVEVTPEAKEEASSFKINAYFRMEANNTVAIKEALLKQPLWTSIMLRSGFYNVGNDGIIPEDNYLLGGELGGHSVALIGWKYIDNKLYWEFKNSWGDSWGNLGYFYLEDSLFRSTVIGGIYYLETNDNLGQDLVDIYKNRKLIWQKLYYKVMEFLSNLVHKFSKKF